MTGRFQTCLIKAGSAGVAVLVAGGLAACPLSAGDGRTLSGEGVSANWRVIDGPLRVSRPFALEVHACPEDVDLTKVDASMPAHRHGMNYSPSIVAAGPGRWRVEGLLWHMPGAWELVLTLQRDGVVQRLTRVIELQ